MRNIVLNSEDYDGHFTPEEQEVYRKMLRENSEDTGINIFELMEELEREELE